MKILKRIIYALLGLLLTGAVALVGVILYAEYSGSLFHPGEAAVMADAGLADGESRLVYDENGNLAELPGSVPADTAVPADAGTNPAAAAADAGASLDTAAAADTEAAVSSSSADNSAEHNYVMDKGSNLFHNADCPYAANITEENRAEMNTTRGKIMDAGYNPCSNCNP